MNNRILVVGAGGHSRVVREIIELGGHEIVGLVDDFLSPGTVLEDWKVLGAIADIGKIAQEFRVDACAVAIGDNTLRERVVDKIRTLWPQVIFPILVHPMAVLSRNLEMEEGTVVMAGAILNPGARIGKFCILNTQCSLDHDGRLGDFASLAPGAILGGNVQVGRRSAIGLGAHVIHGMQIEEDVVIGAGALVVKHVPALVVSYGIPAQIMRTRVMGEKYL